MSTVTTTPARRGRPPKGRREQISAKVPADHKPVLERAAEAQGMPLCDYVAVVLAEHHGLPMPSYINKGDEPFPNLGGAA